MSAQIAITNWQLNIDADMVLRGQGADPAVIRQRKPKLVEIAERALAEGMRLIQPAVIYRILSVELLRHEKMVLAGGVNLTGSLLVQHLAKAQQVALIVCTLGDMLEKQSSTLMYSDSSYAFALDGFGSAAVETLGTAICSKLDADARRSDSYVSVPLSPGMIGWSVDNGQRQIFSALDAAHIGVTLNHSAQMTPRKSTSMILGISPTPFSAGRTCDFCGLRETCRYQNRDTHFDG